MDFPFFWYEPQYQIGIYSKYSIINKGVLVFDINNGRLCLWIDLAWHCQIIRVYNFHLVFNRPDITTTSSGDKGKVSQLINILKNYPYYSNKRLEQVGKVRAHQQNSSHPSILVGDFNDVANSYLSRVLRKDLKDAFLEKGQGLGTTYKKYQACALMASIQILILRS